MEKSSILGWLSRNSNRAIRIRQAAVLAIVLGCAACKPAATMPAASESQIAAGAEAFAMNCAQCHYDGSATETMPALKGSATLSGNPEKAIRIILYGQRGVSEVGGRTLGGIMPAQAYLSDAKIAAIVTYIRAEFADDDTSVTEADVKALR